MNLHIYVYINVCWCQRFIQFLASNNVTFTLDSFNDGSSVIG